MGRKPIAKVIAHAGTDRLETEAEIAEKRALKTVRRSSVTLSLAERIANDSFSYLNWKLPNASELFPNDWRLRFVAKYFPFAENGPIGFDFPKNDSEIKDCELKAKVLRPLGFRYVIITPKTDEASAFDQLESKNVVVDLPL